MASAEGSISDPAGRGRPGPGTPAIVCGRNGETRLLLRGLLRLHRYRVLLEAASAGELDQRPLPDEPTAFVFDAESEVAPWDTELAAVLRGHPSLRAVVLLPRAAPPSCEARARLAGARAVVARPFAIRDLVDALETAVTGAPAPPRQP